MIIIWQLFFNKKLIKIKKDEGIVYAFSNEGFT